MDTTYLMAGIRLETDGTLEGLNKLLEEYELVAEADNASPTNVRRISDEPFFHRYSVVDSYGPISRRIDDYCVGEIIGQNEYGHGVGRASQDDIGEALRVVREDIPDAGILYFTQVD
jgi:hypothetical protein